MTETQQKKICPLCGFISNTSDTICPNDSTALQAMLEDPMIGKVVAKRYKIVSRLGRGGMSVVYKAHHQFMDRLVAIKMLRSELASDDDSLKRLQIESKAISALKHPNIVPVYDFGMLENDIPFLVMEYLEGEDLDRFIKTSAPINYTEAIPKFISICDGLEHAHQNGIIHRDIKPSNIILITENDGEKVPVIVDFGIAKMVDLNGEDLNKLTATGQVFGSPLYMSPEQCSARRPDARSDIYSVGCVMYLALTGQSPLKGNTPVDTMVKHIQASPKPFSEVLGTNDIPTKVELCVFKALEKDPDHRFNSMQEFSDALKNCINSLSYNSYRPDISSKSSAEQFKQSLESNVQPQPQITSGIEDSVASEQIEETPASNDFANEHGSDNTDTGKKDSLQDINSDENYSQQTIDFNEDSEVKETSNSPNSLIVKLAIGVLLLSGALFMGYSFFSSNSEKPNSGKNLTDAEEVKIEKIRSSKNGKGHLPFKEFQKVSLAKFKPEPFIEEGRWVLLEHNKQELVDPSKQTHRSYSGVIYKISFDYNERNYEQVASQATIALKKRSEVKLNSDTFDDVMVGSDKRNRVKKQQIEYTLSNGRTILSYVVYYKSEDKLRALQLIPTVDYSGSYSEQEKANQKTEALVDSIIRYCFKFTKVKNPTS